MCDSVEKSSSPFFRPWKQQQQQEEDEEERQQQQHDDEPSAFSPIESRRSCSVSSDDASSTASGSLAMLRNFVDEKTSVADEHDDAALWANTAATTCYQLQPTAYHHHHHPAATAGFFPADAADYSWLASSYQSVQEAVNRLNQQDAVAKQIKKLRPKKFKCEYCMVAFSNNGQLKGHLRIHTGERPFKCDADGCGKSFTRNEELTRHKRIHTGLRPYLCPVCRKGFGRKDHLKKHSKTHDARHVVPGYHQQLAMAAVAAYASGYPTALPYALV